MNDKQRLSDDVSEERAKIRTKPVEYVCFVYSNSAVRKEFLPKVLSIIEC